MQVLGFFGVAKETRGGSEGLKPWEEQQFWSDGRLWLRTLVLARMANQCSPDMLTLLQQPEEDPAAHMDKYEAPTFTNWPELVDMLEGHLALQRVGLDQGALGHSRRKPTTLWSNMQEIIELDGLRDHQARPLRLGQKTSRRQLAYRRALLHGAKDSKRPS